MKLGRIVVLLVLSALAGCGVETMGAAATSAAARKQELEQAQKAEQQARQKMDQVMQLQRERLQGDRLACNARKKRIDAAGRAR